MAEMEHLGGKRAESARARRAEQLRRWRGSLTEQEPADRPGAELPPQAQRGGPRVRFEDGAVFLAACSSGDTDEVRRLLARGADVDTANVDGLTALHQVSARGRWPSRLPPPPVAGVPAARQCPHPAAPSRRGVPRCAPAPPARFPLGSRLSVLLGASPGSGRGWRVWVRAASSGLRWFEGSFRVPRAQLASPRPHALPASVTRAGGEPTCGITWFA